MQFRGWGSISFPLFLKWVIVIFLANFCLNSDADPRISEAGRICGTNTTLPSIIIPQYTKEMQVVTQLVREHGWGSYAVNSTDVSIYALANCYQDLPHNDCLQCFLISCSKLPNCLPAVSGRVYLDGCFLRYDYYNFLGETTDSVEDKVNCTSSLGGAITSQDQLALVAAAGNLIENVTKTAITNDGYAVAQLNGVYGLAQCWRTVSKQGCRECLDKARELINGCLPNRDARALMAGCYLRYSTHNFLNHPSQGTRSDKNKIKILAWKERLHIIVGTAEGLAYLHGGLEMRIIHRDIKSSNVLVDENFDAKIADFGLARCLAADKTHISTGIAGTIGYMAPEYLVNGQLTEKADVYSYGVLILEIVCGRKNISLVEDDSGSLLQTVWKLYTTDQVTKVIDPSLKGDFPPEEASKILKVGLLCTQASVTLRPSMSDVVQMLLASGQPISEPCQPPFLNSCSNMKSLVSNAFSKQNESCTSTAENSSSMQYSSDGHESLLKQAEENKRSEV
ncbi:unnamed protein product [Withania somnifera]